MPICPSCKGKGTQTMTVQEWVKGKGFVAEPPSEIPCVTCHGIGVVSKEKEQEIKGYEKLWCTCGKGDDTPIYVEDSPLYKHHWVCSHCGKITQIG